METNESPPGIAWQGETMLVQILEDIQAFYCVLRYIYTARRPPVDTTPQVLSQVLALAQRYRIHGLEHLLAKKLIYRPATAVPCLSSPSPSSSFLTTTTATTTPPDRKNQDSDYFNLSALPFGAWKATGQSNDRPLSSDYMFFRVQGSIYTASRVVLSIRSRFFEGMFCKRGRSAAGDWQENCQPASPANPIELKEIQAEDWLAVLQFIYHGKLAKAASLSHVLRLIHWASFFRISSLNSAID
eukprot:g3507.t1